MTRSARLVLAGLPLALPRPSAARTWHVLPDGTGNVSVDPLFRDMAADGFTLAENFPCAPGYSPCGLIGALPVGCGPVSAEAMTWGR